MPDWPPTKEDFDRLLTWLDPDRDQAGEHYERIRRKLILILTSHGWSSPEEMTDACIDRVIKKLPEIGQEYKGAPEFYFYRVANFIELEWPRKERSIELPPGPEPSDIEGHLACLDRCLDGLPDASRKLVLEYYQHEKKAKIDHRAALAQRMGIAANALRIRAHRIRQHLEGCVIDCLGGKPLAGGS